MTARELQPFPDRAALLATQLARLRKLTSNLLRSNEFYRRKLASAGVDEAIDSIADYSSRFPFTTKAELVADQQAHPPFGTNLTHPLADYTRYHQTSGTRGAPLRWLDTPDSWESMVESWIEIFRAGDVRAGDRALFAFSFGPFLGFWLAFEAAQRIGCLCIPGGGAGSASRLASILDNRVTVLCCTPTYAIRLAEVAAQEHLDLTSSAVRIIVVAGEAGGSIPATRERISRLWNGARVFDHHGMTETGPVTFECPVHPCALHVMESAYLPEVIHPETGRPITDGETGELVLTTLLRAGSPLLRYRTGDLVKPLHVPGSLSAPPCPCGRSHLRLEGGILGRVDDMVVVRGVNVYPSAIEDIVNRIGNTAEYQVVIHQSSSRVELTLRVEPAPGCEDPVALAHRIESGLNQALSLRVPVETVSPGTLPRYEMKANRWIRC